MARAYRQTHEANLNLMVKPGVNLEGNLVGNLCFNLRFRPAIFELAIASLRLAVRGPPRLGPSQNYKRTLLALLFFHFSPSFPVRLRRTNGIVERKEEN